MTVNRIDTAIPIPYDALADFCEQHHITRMWLFGSVLGDAFTGESDVDVLVEIDPAHIPGWDFFTWADELEAIFGRSVDLGTPKSLSHYIRDRVMDSAQVVYDIGQTAI